MGGPQFQSLSGCLPPCEYDGYEVVLRTIKNPVVMAGYGANVSSMAISLKTTTKRTVRDALLYGPANLLGDVGGFLGMFLGISLVSIYLDASILVKMIIKSKRF